MRPLLEIDATVTERGQTTIPSAIRRMLGIGKGDSIVFRGMKDGTIVLARKDDESEHDPALSAFLHLLEADLRLHPEAIAGVDEKMLQKARSLSEGVDVDLDRPLDDE